VREIGKIEVDQVVIGSCTNGHLDDLRVAARILKGRKVASSLRLIIIPATQDIFSQAMKEGLLKIFLSAGAVVSPPTCGPCLGGHMGILASGEKALARGLLDRAIDAYLKGFEADWRDAYPGVNAVTLMELNEPPDPRREQLIPVVRYAVERKIAAVKPDYWDHATLLELGVLAKDEEKAMTGLSNALAAVRESWEPETTARNLRLIRETRERRGESIRWAKEIEQELEREAGKSDMLEQKS
jgi:hypothetical protein